MYIQIVGSGKLADAIAACCRQKEIEYKFLSYQGRIGGATEDDLAYHTKKSVIIHVGSGRELKEAIQWAAKYDVPLIQGSTDVSQGQIDAITAETDREVTLIHAPNFSIPMVHFMKAFPVLAKEMLPCMETRFIIESHQSGKKDISGTARALSREMDVSEDRITSIRDETGYVSMGVTPCYYDGHAYHTFYFQGDGVRVVAETKIEGRETYAVGAVKIAEAILQHRNKLMFKQHFLPDIIDILEL